MHIVKLYNFRTTYLNIGYYYICSSVWNRLDIDFILILSLISIKKLNILNDNMK